ncbi:MAG: hypothetical protein SFU98_07820, partial [Leptospiraceae bacterium]|nr:hypothetical protein [Leptospiraceae bacterium]
GSQMHDTCCSSNPNGNNCGGNNSSTACKKEWDHAVNDTVAGDRNWTVTFNPTVVTYRGSSQSKITESFSIGSNYTSRPLAGSFKAPVNEKIWDVDAAQGWCVNPTSHTRYCVPITGPCWSTCN